MTLIVHIPAKNGLVMASDGQATTGIGIKIMYKKIYELNDSCIWGMTGETIVQERVEERIATLSDKEKPIQDLCPTLRDIITKCVEELSAGMQPPSLVEEKKPQPPYSGLFAFIEYRDYPRILYIFADGTVRWQSAVAFAIGSGAPFALALLRKYQSLGKLDLQLAAVLAYKIIAETIEVIEGVGPPIDVWQLPPAKNLTKEELTGLEETYLGLKKEEIEMFLRGNR